MAKKSWLARDRKKAETVKKYAALRAELKAKGEYAALSKLPKNASPVRQVRRCRISGRRHAFIRKYGISRLTFRELALSGQIPGVTKASW
jgi:small subunit ribosomal protein S14